MTAQDVLDVKTTAFEGGINYWAQIERTRTSKRDEALNYLGAWTIVEIGDFADPSEFKRHTLTDAKLRKGIKLAAAAFDLTQHAFIENCDANYADIAVQFALLGEITYG